MKKVILVFIILSFTVIAFSGQVVVGGQDLSVDVPWKYIGG